MNNNDYVKLEYERTMKHIDELIELNKKHNRDVSRYEKSKIRATEMYNNYLKDNNNV